MYCVGSSNSSSKNLQLEKYLKEWLLISCIALLILWSEMASLAQESIILLRQSAGDFFSYSISQSLEFI